MKELRDGWNFFPCGCTYVVNLRYRMVCSFDGPNSDHCEEMQGLRDVRLGLVRQTPTDWDAVWLNTRRMAEHVNLPQDLIERGYYPERYRALN